MSIPIIGPSISVTGLNDVSGPYSLLNGGAYADTIRLYLVNCQVVSTTTDPTGTANEITFRLDYVDEGGTSSIDFDQTWIHADNLGDDGCTFDQVGRSDFQVVAVRGLVGQDITIRTIFAAGSPGGLTTGTYAFRATVLGLT